MVKRRQNPPRRKETPVISKWVLQNQYAFRAVTSVAGMTVLSLVLAAPGKWNAKG